MYINTLNTMYFYMFIFCLNL